MEAPRKIVYEFEHADSLERLRAKTVNRTRNGWMTSGDPRELAIQISEFSFGIRYCQTFYRYSDESISKEPWITMRRSLARRK